METVPQIFYQTFFISIKFNIYKIEIKVFKDCIVIINERRVYISYVICLK